MEENNMVISKHQYIKNWIEENFEAGAIVNYDWHGKHAVTLIDRAGDKLDITMPERTLYVDGKPMGGIPSMADITE